MNRQSFALIFFFSLYTLAAPRAFAAAADKQLELNGKSVTFQYVVGDLLVSRDCGGPGATCQALQKARIATTRGIESIGGAEPGSLICRKLGGKFLIARDKNKNEYSFCVFEDGSMTSNATLYSEALRNDTERRKQAR